MRAADNLSPSVPVIAELWNGTSDEVVDSVGLIAVHSGVSEESGPDSAATLSRILGPRSSGTHTLRLKSDSEG
jgi:hypothetical protein